MLFRSITLLGTDKTELRSPIFRLSISFLIYHLQILLPHSLQLFARAWDMQTQNVTETRLLRLEPSTIACRPQDVCHFTAVFDREEDIRELRFSLDDASAGELQEDGTFTAGQKSGCLLYTSRCV